MLLTECNYDTKVLTEGEGQAKNWFVTGIFMQAECVNRNRRIYPLSIMEREINQYNTDFVKTRRAVGELQHPPTPEINLDKVSHIIENISQEKNAFIGKAKILNTPAGNICKGLLEGGVQLGVSSRGMGSVVDTGRGISQVQGDFKLATVDIVYSPSAPDAFVQGLMENAPFVWNTLEEDVQFLEALKKEVKAAPVARINEEQMKVWTKLMVKLAG